MNTPEQFLAWVAANPRDRGPDGESAPSSWAGKCVSLVRRAGAFPVSNTASTAALARTLTVRNGHPMAITRYDEVPYGWFVYFDGPTSDGHIGMCNGSGTFTSATSRVPGALGSMRIADYASIRGVTYRGASPYFINLTLAESPPTPPPVQEGKDMKNISHPNGSLMSVDTFYHEEFSGSDVVGYTAAAETWGAFTPVSAASYLRQKNNAVARRAAFIAEVAAASGTGAGGFTAADRAMLDAIPNQSEMGSILTAQTNVINAHTTEEVDGITAGTAPTEFSITLSGSATAE